MTEQILMISKLKHLNNLINFCARVICPLMLFFFQTYFLIYTLYWLLVYFNSSIFSIVDLYLSVFVQTNKETFCIFHFFGFFKNSSLFYRDSFFYFYKYWNISFFMLLTIKSFGTKWFMLPELTKLLPVCKKSLLSLLFLNR